MKNKMIIAGLIIAVVVIVVILFKPQHQVTNSVVNGNDVIVPSVEPTAVNQPRKIPTTVSNSANESTTQPEKRPTPQQGIRGINTLPVVVDADETELLEDVFISTEEMTDDGAIVRMQHIYVSAFNERNLPNRKTALMEIFDQIKNYQGDQYQFGLTILNKLTPIEITDELIVYHGELMDKGEQQQVLDILVDAKRDHRRLNLAEDFTYQETVIEDYIVFVTGGRTDEHESRKMIEEMTRRGDGELETIRESTPD